MENENESFETPPVTFELNLPEEMNSGEVLSLLEVLQSDVQGFDEMLLNAVTDIQEDQTLEAVTKTELQPNSSTEVSHINTNLQPLPDSISEVTTAQRFKTLQEQDLLEIETNQYSNSTKKNTKWGIGVFNAWCMERLNEVLDLHTISAPVLDENLRKFYAEAQPKNLSSRVQKMPQEHAAEYHKNSMKNVRAAINRYLKDIGRQIDIVKDTEFKSSNAMLSSKLKFNLKQGLSRPTKHHAAIPNEDLMKINTYLSGKNPVALRFRIWYLLAIHFVSRGCEFHHQLSLQSLKFQKDENGIEYITITHETHQKNNQGGLDGSSEEAQDKRMYATGKETCPVQSMKLFISKTDPKATSLFNECDKDALHSEDPEAHDIWYSNVPVKPKRFTTFMPDICKNATTKRYTAHSLRTTSITAMSDAGLTDRNIMFMSDHKCEESLKSYCRRPSVQQKKMISSVLGSVAAGVGVERNPDLPVVPAQGLPNPICPLPCCKPTRKY
ncbi:uncharacterized protein LOC134236294 [Saccostrea cucullata]|uniref:uncharacterized protein LOC134236294 n=1 Tax=Saccostrea cuccullata TaxID=36930 RepID=UPI002ED3870A